MGMNITEKLIKNHLVSGEMVAGKEIAIKIDQTLTQALHRHHGVSAV